MTQRSGIAALRRILAAAALGAAAFGATGCGFAPLYAQSNADFAPLRNVRVQSMDSTRLDYVFETVMADKLGAYAPSGEYVLEAILSETRQGYGIRVDDVATRYESAVTASYRLRRMSDGAVVADGRRTGVSSYDVTDDPYAELSSEQRALERAVELVADKVRLDLTLFFANQPQET